MYFSIIQYTSKESSGLLEMGSTSLQIAFEPRTSSNPIPSNYSEEVTVNGQKYNIYAHSYMCMGRDEFGRRYYAKLAVVSLIYECPPISQFHSKNEVCMSFTLNYIFICIKINVLLLNFNQSNKEGETEKIHQEQ